MPDDEPMVGGLFLSQLDWLCHPSRIDNTLRLLWLVNLWAKARERLYYADRQGLYQVKQAILSHAYRLGAIQPTAYVDGTALAFQDLNPAFAPSVAAETLRDNLLEVFQVPNMAKTKCPLCGNRHLGTGPQRLKHWQTAHADHSYLKLSWAGWMLGMDKSQAKLWLPSADYQDIENNTRYWHVDRVSQVVVAMDYEQQQLVHEVNADGQRALQLYQQITGQVAKSRSDVDNLPLEIAEMFFEARLEELQRQAIATRQPIPWQALEAMWLYPSDMMDTTAFRWEDLDDSDLRKLDPEGLSLIGFRYASEQVQMTFLIPYRIAAGFLAADVPDVLRATPTEVREEGQFYGRAITDDERQQHPIEELLMDLGVDIDTVCPKGLVDRQAAHPSRFETMEEATDFYDDDDDDQEWFPLDPPEWSNPDWVKKTCPICSAEIPQPHLRFQHWLEEHSTYTVLTSGQAAWVLDQNAYSIKTQYPCDFLAHINSNITRLWLLSSLEKIYHELMLK
ncbi:MAG: hypothetical protein H6673_05530 [Anaerolineales bacterium]|nr:hypothetical protein [Anaerolineales bacterium]